ncbi:T9SS type A sorting domain-containing protein [bacterium]|nr:T9SS type A sorting domain-containing protein [bacterium]
MKKNAIVWFGFFCIMGAALLNAQGHSDIIQIATAGNIQHIAQAECDPVNNQYLVVWEDYRNNPVESDIYGQFVTDDGSLKGENFIICDAQGDQWWPRLAFDPANQRFLVVFEDNRNGMDQGDISGVFIDSNGDFVDSPTSRADHTYGICTESHDIYTCSVAYNYLEQVYLVVWGDNRSLGDVQGEQWGVDIYGQLVAADGSLILPADPEVNFAVDDADWYEASVPDVTYNEYTNEFFVAYGTSFANGGYVLGQRVNHQAQRVNPDGTIGGLAKPSKTTSVWPALFISILFNNGPDCLQARVCARIEYLPSAIAKTDATRDTEVLVVWKGQNANTLPDYYNDIYGQRIGFKHDGEKYQTVYLALDGTENADVSNFPLSLQPDWVNPPDLAYSTYDEEFLVAWGDPRNGGWENMDLYAQRLGIDSADNMSFLDDDRINTVTHTENIPIDITEVSETSPLGVAHNPSTNKFLVAYQYNDASTDRNIYGHIFYGTEMFTDVGSHEFAPDAFELSGNYPNPFNPSTTVSFEIPSQAEVSVRIYDIQGRTIAELCEESMSAGLHMVQWDGTDDQGMQVPSGIYVCRVQHGRDMKSTKMMLMR